jgi:hypothetical protein
MKTGKYPIKITEDDMGALLYANVIKEKPKISAPQGGRPPVNYLINPKVEKINLSREDGKTHVFTVKTLESQEETSIAKIS